MSYDATNDLATMDATRPVGSTETVSILDEALRETRLCLKTVFMVGHGSTGAHTAGIIATATIADSAVTAAKIADGTITIAKLATTLLTGLGAAVDAGSIPGTAIADDGITTAKINASAVTATEIASNAVTEAKILAAAVTTTKLGGGEAAKLLIGQADGSYLKYTPSGDVTMGATGVFTATNRSALYSDQKAFGTNGGTFTAGAWQTRDLNSEDYDGQNIGTLAANAVTLVAGTYLCIAFAAVNNVGIHRLRLYNVTDAAQALLGPVCITPTPGQLMGVFTIAAEKAMRLDHYCTVTQADTGCGYPFNVAGNVETYAQVMFTRIA